MSGPDREIHNPRTGQRMRFLRTAADTNGARLRIETVNPPTAMPSRCTSTRARRAAPN